ncbi:MAG: hypothetical protein IJU45_03030 [Clostridia bacterium]|nr:hypothetical protein [Clostridia bacterium]
MKENLRLNQRASGVELLKIIGIMLIVISHCVQTTEKFINFQAPTWNETYLIMRFLRFGGNVGNLIFVISSSYFLAGRSKVKGEKAANILLDSQFISVIILGVTYIISMFVTIAVKFEFRFVYENLFPDIFSKVWFIPAYVILYLTHPFLNQIIDGLDKKSHMKINVCLFFVYGVTMLVKGAPQYSNLLGFFIIYFYVAYVKKYQGEYTADRKKNTKAFIIMLIIFIAVVLVKNYLAFRIKWFKTFPEIKEMTSVIFFPMIMSLFNIFLNFKFTNKTVNSVSSLTLFIYCIHENYIIRTYFRPFCYRVMTEKFGAHYLYFALGLAAAIFIASLILAKIYQLTLHKLTAKLSIKLNGTFIRKFDVFFNKLNS